MGFSFSTPFLRGVHFIFDFALGYEIIIVILSLVIFLISASMASAATNYLQGYSSVDSSKEIKWGGSTKYSTQWNVGISTWNALKKIKITPDTWYTYEDLTVSDVNRTDYDWYKTAGLYTWGKYVDLGAETLQLNDYLMKGFSNNQKQFVTTHELGHALGLGHSFYENIEDKYVDSRTVLGTQDITDYRYLWGY